MTATEMPRAVDDSFQLANKTQGGRAHSADTPKSIEGSKKYA